LKTKILKQTKTTTTAFVTKYYNSNATIIYHYCMVRIQYFIAVFYFHIETVGCYLIKKKKRLKELKKKKLIEKKNIYIFNASVFFKRMKFFFLLIFINNTC
jgi:hypothetical protein